ncbi:hypothetical protein ACWF2D_09065, partial [Bacillus subtilis]
LMLYRLMNSKPKIKFANNSEFDKPPLLKQSKKPLLRKGLSYDSDWARTSDLYPVKVAASDPISQSVSQTLVYQR